MKAGLDKFEENVSKKHVKKPALFFHRRLPGGKQHQGRVNNSMLLYGAVTGSQIIAIGHRFYWHICQHTETEAAGFSAMIHLHSGSSTHRMRPTAYETLASNRCSRDASEFRPVVKLSYSKTMVQQVRGQVKSLFVVYQEECLAELKVLA